jgi:hypothetical protein
LCRCAHRQTDTDIVGTPTFLTKKENDLQKFFRFAFLLACQHYTYKYVYGQGRLGGGVGGQRHFFAAPRRRCDGLVLSRERLIGCYRGQAYDKQPEIIESFLGFNFSLA